MSSGSGSAWTNQRCCTALRELFAADQSFVSPAPSYAIMKCQAWDDLIHVTMLNLPFAMHRSPWKRLVEVIVLVLITSAIWFTVAYMSPCRPLPQQVPSHPQTQLRSLIAFMTVQKRTGTSRAAMSSHLARGTS